MNQLNKHVCEGVTGLYEASTHPDRVEVLMGCERITDDKDRHALESEIHRLVSQLDEGFYYGREREAVPEQHVARLVRLAAVALTLANFEANGEP